MRSPSALLSNENNWHTTAGSALPGQPVIYRDKDLFKDLKDSRWLQLLMYGITGRSFDEKQIKLLEGIWVICTSYPEARLWNNRIAALAGTVRTTGSLGIAAAIAASEASIYGQRPAIKSIEFLIRTQENLDKGHNLKTLITHELKTQRVIPGYGRPLIGTDERIPVMMSLAEELGYANGSYVKLAFDIEKTLLDGRWRLHMNAASLIAALVADQGIKAREHYLYMIQCFTAGMLPCYVESASHPEGTFLPIRCSGINYIGPQRRAWTSAGTQHNASKM